MSNINFSNKFKLGFSIKFAENLNEFKAFKEELDLLSPKAVPKRKKDFLLGRFACHEALEKLGEKKVPILKAESGEPIFPEGIVGSISHSNECAIAAVSYKKEISSLGIDIEYINQKISINIAKKICHESEYNWIMEENSQLRLKTIFSSKESIFKAFYTLTKVYLFFKDVEIKHNNNKIFAKLKRNVKNYPKGFEFEIKFHILNKYIITFVYL